MEHEHAAIVGLHKGSEKRACFVSSVKGVFGQELVSASL